MVENAMENKSEYIRKGVQDCQGMVYQSGQDIWAKTWRVQQLHSPSRLTARAKALTWEHCWAHFVKQQGNACVAGAEKVRGLAVGGRQRRSRLGQITEHTTGHHENFAFTLSQETVAKFFCKGPHDTFQALQATQSPLQLFNSAVVTPKTPETTRKWKGGVVFQ